MKGKTKLVFSEWWEKVGVESPEILKIRILATRAWLAGMDRGRDKARVQVNRLVDVIQDREEEIWRLKESIKMLAEVKDGSR